MPHSAVSNRLHSNHQSYPHTTHTTLNPCCSCQHHTAAAWQYSEVQADHDHSSGSRRVCSARTHKPCEYTLLVQNLGLRSNGCSKSKQALCSTVLCRAVFKPIVWRFDAMYMIKLDLGSLKPETLYPTAMTSSSPPSPLLHTRTHLHYALSHRYAPWVPSDS